MNTYATLAQLRAFLSASGTDMSVSDDDKLTQYLVWASRLIDRRCYRQFYPRSETRTYDYQGSARVLIVDDDLLAVSALTVDDETVSSDEYVLYPLNGSVKHKIEMNLGGGSIFTYSDTPQEAVSVLGMWGYHEDWSNAWADSQDTVEDDPFSNSATTLTVNNVDGADANGLTPRFSVGSLLKIGSEYLAVTATNASAQTATVQRGVNGTTAAAHDQDTAIHTFTPFVPATTAVLDLAKWLYEHRQAAGGIVALPSLEGTAIKSNVDEILAAHRLPVRPSNLIRRR